MRTLKNFIAHFLPKPLPKKDVFPLEWVKEKVEWDQIAETYKELFSTEWSKHYSSNWSSLRDWKEWGGFINQREEAHEFFTYDSGFSKGFCAIRNGSVLCSVGTVNYSRLGQ